MKSSRILIVDDNPVDRTLLKKILVTIGTGLIDEAENGRIGSFKATTAVEEMKPYDIIFVDWNMPVLNGIDLVRELRSEPMTKNAKIIMLTGASEFDNVKDALAAGVTDFVVKPFTPQVI